MVAEITFGTTQESRFWAAPHLQGVHSARWSISPLDLRQWLPAHPYYRQSAHFHFLVFGLSWATRLCGRNELSDQLSDRHAFNMTWGRTTNRSLTDTDRDRLTAKTSIPCCFSINIPPGLFFIHQHMVISMIANIANHDQTSSKLVGDRKSPRFYQSKHG